MAIQWQVFLRILLAILRILAELPPEIDQRPICQQLADATDQAINGGIDPK